jgi:branched-chain amino acid transport system substrate-binding protein
MSAEMSRRSLLAGAAAMLAAPAIARAADTPGVTATSIKIGQTEVYSGPASAYGAIGHAETAFFKMINDQGGINGRKIDFISVDDGYSPPRTVEQTRKLVEEDGVAFVFNGLGTPTNSAVQKYLNAKKVPQLFVSTGADKWGDYRNFPWTMGWQPSYRTEAEIYAHYAQSTKPDGKIGVLYQNDDFGKDYLAGLKDALGDKYDQVVTKTVSYEVTDPTVDSQIVTLQGSGVDILLTAATPKFAAQTIRKVADLNWHPLHFMTNVSISVGAVLQPAGLDKSTGIITSAYLKDNSDPKWANDPGMAQWRGFMKQWMPDGDLSDSNIVYGYGVAQTLVQVLRQCGDDVSRANIMKQAANLHDLEIAVLLPGIRVNTSPTNFHPIRQMQLQKWNGRNWELFGDVLGSTPA